MAVKSAEKHTNEAGEGPGGSDWGRGCQWGSFSEQTLEGGRSHVVSGGQAFQTEGTASAVALRGGNELSLLEELTAGGSS